MNAKARTAKELTKIYGSGVIIALIIMVIAYQFVAPAPPRTLTIATASKTGAYYGFGQEYKKFFSQEGIELKVLETSGSAENLELLAKNEVEVAFVQGGVGKGETYPELSGLASLYMEPLLIFARADEEVETLLDVRGKSLAIGPEGSGTRSIMLTLLKDNGLDNEPQVTLDGRSGKEAIDALLGGEVDLVFMVTRPETQAVLEILSNPRIKLVSLPRVEAYARRHPYLSNVLLPRGVFDPGRDLPLTDIHCIAPAATLVAGPGLHPALSDLLMQITSKVHGHGVRFNSTTSFPSPSFLDFPLSNEAKRFFKNGPPLLQRYLPFWAASLIDRLKVMLLPLIALIIPLVKVLPPTYRWRTRSKIYRWYDELHQLDWQAGEVGASTQLLTETVIALDRMEDEVRQLEVPLSYAEELYHLRLHLDLLRTQLQRKLGM